MANLSITVSGDLYTIALDVNDWTGLQVNGTTIAESSSGGWTYTQPSQGLLNFVATADSVTIVNPDNVFYLAGTNHVHQAVLMYSTPASTNSGTFQVAGTLVNYPSGPFTFSQGMMTGTFS
jgi:hypothetical protein